MAVSAVCSGRGEPVHPCERTGGGWGAGVSAQGREGCVPRDKLQQCPQRSKAQSIAFAPLAKASGLSWRREGGPRGLCSATDIPLPSFVLQEICASSLPSAAPRSIATRCGSHALLISPAGSGRCLLQAGGLGPAKAGLSGDLVRVSEPLRVSQGCRPWVTQGLCCLCARLGCSGMPAVIQDVLAMVDGAGAGGQGSLPGPA